MRIYQLLTLIVVAYVLVLLPIMKKESQDSIKEYCEMTGIWLQDKENGVIELNRRGWPDYLGNRDEVCIDD